MWALTDQHKEQDRERGCGHVPESLGRVSLHNMDDEVEGSKAEHEDVNADTNVDQGQVALADGLDELDVLVVLDQDNREQNTLSRLRQIEAVLAVGS